MKRPFRSTLRLYSVWPLRLTRIVACSFTLCAVMTSLPAADAPETRASGIATRAMVHAAARVRVVLIRDSFRESTPAAGNTGLPPDWIAEQPVDRSAALVAEVDTELVDVERDVRVADLVRQLLRVGPDVLAARFRVSERVLDRSTDRRFDPIGALDIDAGEDA